MKLEVRSSDPVLIWRVIRNDTWLPLNYCSHQSGFLSGKVQLAIKSIINSNVSQESRKWPLNQNACKESHMKRTHLKLHYFNGVNGPRYGNIKGNCFYSTQTRRYRLNRSLKNAAEPPHPAPFTSHHHIWAWRLFAGLERHVYLRSPFCPLSFWTSLQHIPWDKKSNLGFNSSYYLTIVGRPQPKIIIAKGF